MLTEVWNTHEFSKIYADVKSLRLLKMLKHIIQIYRTFAIGSIHEEIRFRLTLALYCLFRVRKKYRGKTRHDESKMYYLLMSMSLT
jgi:hypothetical protein